MDGRLVMEIDKAFTKKSEAVAFAKQQAVCVRVFKAPRMGGGFFFYVESESVQKHNSSSGCNDAVVFTHLTDQHA